MINKPFVNNKNGAISFEIAPILKISVCQKSNVNQLHIALVGLNHLLDHLAAD